MDIIPTLLLAVIFFIISLALFATGWLLTGKTKIQAGACGRDPHKKKASTDGCGITYHCTLCEKEEKESEKKPLSAEKEQLNEKVS